MNDSDSVCVLASVRLCTCACGRREERGTETDRQTETELKIDTKQSASSRKERDEKFMSGRGIEH